MPEVIVDILNKIADAKGQEYAKGFVDGVNLVTPERTETEDQPGWGGGVGFNQIYLKILSFFSFCVTHERPSESSDSIPGFAN